MVAPAAVVAVDLLESEDEGCRRAGTEQRTGLHAAMTYPTTEQTTALANPKSGPRLREHPPSARSHTPGFRARNVWVMAIAVADQTKHRERTIVRKALKTVTAVAVTLAIVFASTAAFAQSSESLGSALFDDVPVGHWADEAIGWAVDNGITTGTSETTFSPNDTLTRAQMVTFLKRYNDNVVTNSTATPSTTPATTNGGAHIVDHYWSQDGETYYVVIGGLTEAEDYCEVHLTQAGRRTGEWSNEAWFGRVRSQVTVDIRYIPTDHTFDGFEWECS